MISAILILTGLIIYLLKSLDFIYLFQTKEFRPDRIIAFIREENLIGLLYFRKTRIPAFTLRNFLITQFIFLNSLIYTFILIRTSVPVLIIFTLLTPVLAFISMLIGVLITHVPVQIYRQRLIDQAKSKVLNSKAVFIGITGSYGKTSTKEFLYQILSQKYKVAKTDKNNNSEVGVAISVLNNLKPESEYFIAELGAYRKGEIKAACGIIRPKYGILTSIGNQHLSLFGSKKNLIAAKAELLEALPQNGKAFINKDIADLKTFVNKTRAKIHLFTGKEIPFPVKSGLIGEHNKQNLVPCIALAQELGVSDNLIAKSISGLKAVRGRLSQEKGINGSTILNDSYNSNVEGFLMAIKTAGRLNFEHKFILSRGLIELGEEKETSYKKIVDALAGSESALLTTDGLFKEFSTSYKVQHFKTEDTLLSYIKDKADKNTLIVIEGRFSAKTINLLTAK